jgi:hypothetical protein
MDPFAPINGISLELYADIGAEISDFVSDTERVAKAVEARGIGRANWEAAVAGWTARMQDMSLMGRVAMAYMPLYQAALARKGPVATASYEDYVSMSAVLKVVGFERMCATYGVSQSQWTQIAGAWNNTIATEYQRFASHASLVEGEAQRIRAGGAPRPLTSIGGAAAQPQIQAAPPPASPQAAAQQAANQAAAAEAQARVQAALAGAQAQAAAAYGRAGQNPFAAPFAAQAAQNVGAYHQNLGGQMAQSLGAAAQQAQAQAVAAPAAPPAARPLAPGAQVLVQWSDGNRYPATVAQVAPGQCLVAFPDGRQFWVAEQSLAS